MTGSGSNPFFTRSEKRRVRRKISHKVKGAARSGFSKLFGISLSPGLGGKPATRRRGRKGAITSSAPASPGVRGDVISALGNLGYTKSQAQHMTPQPQSGEGFDSLFRRAVAKNPGELIIFGNPEKVYRKAQLRKVNPLPAALVAALTEGAGFTAGSKVIEAASKGPSRKLIDRAAGKTPRRKPARGRSHKRNPDELGQATDLFEQFHKRGPSGVFELQRSAKVRQDYTILGPLVALGTDAEKFDRIDPDDDQVVQEWDKLPHMAFLTGPQVDQVKKVLGDPKQYLKNIPLLASSPNGKQLYVLCNEPLTIDLTAFDTDAQKDFVDLGEVTFVVYIAKKPHEVLEWVHTFGEEGGDRPRLAYSQFNKEFFFIGGSYRVEAPGIIN